ncbi:MAG: prepilin-type N-terminal cleavage/methylation domain-containing protein [Gallionella sp.]|nr:prepilin-type N-terminal cleavage/methylation domain-containing protein [Gallionella sp.]
MKNRLRERSDMRPVGPLARQKGLTLIELLVAISILSFIAVLGWRGLDSIVRARVALTGDLEQTRGMQLAFAQLQSDCAHLANSTNLPGRVPLVAEQGRLTLVRTVYADNQPSRLQVVSYRVNDGVLTRRESAATRDLTQLGALWQSAANDADTTQTVTLLSGVASLTMRLWTSEGTGWRAAAEIAQLSGTPVAAANPQTGQTSATSLLLTGLEVSMQLQGRSENLLKIFLLGAV